MCSGSLWAAFRQDICTPEEVQSATLQQILECHEDTEHVRSLSLNGQSSVEQFISIHPVTDYDFYKDKLKEIADGTTPSSALVSGKIMAFLLSSGTSGGSAKMIPRTEKTLAQTLEAFQTLTELGNERGTGVSGKGLAFGQLGKFFTTPSGVPAAGGTTHGLKSPSVRTYMESTLTSPYEVILLDCTTRQSLYAHLVCALVRRMEVNKITANFASNIYEALLLLESCGPLMVEHIRTGEAPEDASLTTKESRKILAEVIKEAQPGLVDELQEAFAPGGQGLVNRVWPRCRQIGCVTSGSMAIYPPLMQRFTDGALPILSGIYGASECMIGLNTDVSMKPGLPAEPAYTFMLRQAFFEFIPVETSQTLEEQAAEGWRVEDIRRVHQLELGQSYEVVVTSYAGLYRYRMKDIVKVVGFDEATPKVAFQYRAGALLNIHAERSSEDMLSKALAAALSDINSQEGTDVQLIEYTTDADLDSTPACYSIYCELDSRSSAAEGGQESAGVGNLTATTLGQLATSMDRHLSEQNPVYGGDRQVSLLGPLKLHALQHGTFGGFRKHKVEVDGADPTQLKVPRCITGAVLKGIIQQGIVCTAVSASD